MLISLASGFTVAGITRLTKRGSGQRRPHQPRCRPDDHSDASFVSRPRRVGVSAFTASLAISRGSGRNEHLRERRRVHPNNFPRRVHDVRLLHVLGPPQGLRRHGDTGVPHAARYRVESDSRSIPHLRIYR